ncbi:hypothetical protein D3C72_2412620 [compost metagenome]
MNGLDMASADPVGIQEIPDVTGVAVFAERGGVIDRPVLVEQGPQIPGSVERVAGIAEAIGAVFAAAHLDHAFPD